MINKIKHWFLENFPICCDIKTTKQPGADRNTWRLLAYAEKRKTFTVDQVLKSEATRYNK